MYAIGDRDMNRKLIELQYKLSGWAIWLEFSVYRKAKLFLKHSVMHPARRFFKFSVYERLRLDIRQTKRATLIKLRHAKILVPIKFRLLKLKTLSLMRL